MLCPNTAALLGPHASMPPCVPDVNFMGTEEEDTARRRAMRDFAKLAGQTRAAKAEARRQRADIDDNAAVATRHHRDRKGSRTSVSGRYRNQPALPATASHGGGMLAATGTPQAGSMMATTPPQLKKGTTAPALLEGSGAIADQEVCKVVTCIACAC